MALDADRESTSRTAKAGDLTLHFHEAGLGDRPSEAGLPLVMLHGGGPGASAWSNFGACLERFAADFRVLLVDQPGFGGSDKAAIEGHFFTFAADKLAGAARRAGHRAGAPARQQPRRRYGDQVRARRTRNGVGRLVLMGPGGLQQNLFSPDPTEGIKRLYEFGGDPTPGADAGVHQHDGPRPVAGHRRARRRAARRGDRARCAVRRWRRWAPPSWTRTRYEEGMLWREAYKIRAPHAAHLGP